MIGEDDGLILGEQPVIGFVRQAVGMLCVGLELHQVHHVYHPNLQLRQLPAQNADSGQRYLGIPGIFDNEKAFISRLFGFKTFITVPLKPHKTGNFGYFILPI